MMRTGFVLMGLLLGSEAYSQLNEDFNDNDFTSNPAWVCNSGDWVVNNQQLQSNSTAPNASFYISIPSAMNYMVEWSFDLRLQFNTSSANYVEVHLLSTTPGLSDGGSQGYFLRIGNTQDEISLYRKDGTTSVKIIDGSDGATNSSDNSIRIKIVRDASGKFLLWRSVNSNEYMLEGTATDNTYSGPGHFGFVIRQSTASFHQKHFIDNIVIKDFIPDLQPPDVLEANVISSNKLELIFSETLDPLMVPNPGNFRVLPGAILPIHANISTGNSAVVLLEFAEAFEPGINYSIEIKNLADAYGNIMQPMVLGFNYFTSERFDVVIQEFLANPSPGPGLPQAEFIEIKNRSGKPLQLNEWKLVCNSNSSSSFPATILQPDSILIITSQANIFDFQNFGKTTGLNNFPSLPNDNFVLSLVNSSGKIIHAVDYNITWFSNEFKKSGGWTMEMVDVQMPCSESANWKESEDPSGGTLREEKTLLREFLQMMNPRNY